MRVVIDAEESSLKGNDNIEMFMDAIEVFVDSIPKGTEVVLTGIEFIYNPQEEE